MPSTRFGAGDIAQMIKQMGATGAAAQALYAQFAALGERFKTGSL